MAEKPTANPKADVDANFDAQIKQLRKGSEDEATAREGGSNAQWTVPELSPEDGAWKGDLFDNEGMSDPFNRDEANEYFVEATADSENSGVNGDLESTTLQADYLACYERAFRSRHTMRRPRSMAHMTGRRKGHGHERGVLIQMNLEYIRNLIKKSKAHGDST